jgi:hypothetical protein
MTPAYVVWVICGDGSHELYPRGVFTDETAAVAMACRLREHGHTVRIEEHLLRSELLDI